jgi:hypothetical protein
MGAGTTTFNNYQISDNTLSDDGIIQGGVNSILVMNYGFYNNNAAYIKLGQTQTHTINNMFSFGNNQETVKLTANAPALTVNNSIFLGSTNATTRYHNIAVTGGTGTVTVNNSIGLPGWDGLLGYSPSQDYTYSAGVTAGATNLFQMPLYRMGRRPAIIVLGTDDAAALDTYAPMVAAKLAAYGWRGTYAVDTDSMNAARWTNAVALAAAGHEIASHSKSHPDLTTLGAEDLATELSASKTAIETNISGYTCNTFACPGNATNATVQAAILAAGYTGSRGAAGGTNCSMSSLNIFNIGVKALGANALYNSADPEQATVDKMLGGFLEYLKWTGGIVMFYVHNTGELTADGWDKTLAVIAKSGVMVKTLGEAITYITTNGADSGDHMTYTRTFTDASDYRLRAGSPAINAGTDVSLTTDYLGKPIRGVPDIGAYEFQSVGGGLGMGIIYGF